MKLNIGKKELDPKAPLCVCVCVCVCASKTKLSMDRKAAKCMTLPL